jgi:hypothetical protein
MSAMAIYRQQPTCRVSGGSALDDRERCDSFGIVWFFVTPSISLSCMIHDSSSQEEGML